MPDKTALAYALVQAAIRDLTTKQKLTIITKVLVDALLREHRIVRIRYLNAHYNATIETIRAAEKEMACQNANAENAISAASSSLLTAHQPTNGTQQ